MYNYNTMVCDILYKFETIIYAIFKNVFTGGYLLLRWSPQPGALYLEIPLFIDMEARHPKWCYVLMGKRVKGRVLKTYLNCGLYYKHG